MKAMVPMIDFATAMACAFGHRDGAVRAQGAAAWDRKSAPRCCRPASRWPAARLIEEAVLRLDRKATLQPQPATTGRPTSSACKRWLDHRAGDRPADVQALGTTDRQAGARRRPALHRRQDARRTRRGAERAHERLVREAHPRRSARAPRGGAHPLGSGAVAAPGARRRERPRNRGPSTGSAIRAWPSPCRSSPRRSPCRARRRARRSARRPPASTPTKCCARSATRPDRSTRCARVASSSSADSQNALGRKMPVKILEPLRDLAQHHEGEEEAAGDG